MPPRSLARRRAAHLGPQKRRPLVLDAAVKLFVERGFAGTSMEMIAEAAGVTRPVVYDCFPNKPALFEALLEREEQRLLEGLVAAVPEEPNLVDTQALLAQGFTALLRAAAAAPDSWRLLFLSQHGSDPAVAGRLAAGRALVTERIGRLAEMVLAQRGVSDDVERLSRLVAYLLVGQGEAAVRLMLTGPDRWEPDELGELLGQMTAPAERVLSQGRGGGRASEAEPSR